ncbi:MAG: STAS/SEC14 domain-containing protein [Bacteroidota bacterium]
MSDRVQLIDGIICQEACPGGITVESLQEDLLKLLDIQAELQKRKAPVCLLYNAANARRADSGARAQAVYNLSRLNYQRIAVFGIRSVYLRQMARFVILGMGKQRKIRIFSSKEKAEKWLREKSRPIQ